MVNFPPVWFEDGQQVRLWGYSGLAIGWLERGHAYCTGATPANTVERLIETLEPLGWSPVYYLGYHHCDLSLCGLRFRIGSFLGRLSSAIAPNPLGKLTEGIRSRAEDEAQRDAIIHRTLARHRRRHQLADHPVQPKTPTLGASLGHQAELLGARAVDLPVIAVQRILGAAVHVVNPPWFTQHLRFGSTLVKVGNLNLCIPGPSQLYIAPSMILHYIVTHRYRPPDAFCEAVLSCPKIGSRSYFEALKPFVENANFKTWVDDMLDEVRDLESWRQKCLGSGN